MAPRKLQANTCLISLLQESIDETCSRAPERDRCYQSANVANALEDNEYNNIDTTINNDNEYHNNASPVEVCT